MAIDYGSAVRMFTLAGALEPDLDGPLITGPRVALEGVGVVIMTQASSVPWAPTDGVARPLYSLINFTGGDAELRRIEADYASAAEQVSNVITARFAFQRTLRGLSISGAISTAAGLTLPLVATVGDAVKILFPTVPV